MSIHHPLGRDAAPHVNQRTQANRDALAACLRLYYADSLGMHMTKSLRHAQGRTGPELTGPFVSRLEIGSALAELRRTRADLLVVIESIYGRGMTRRDYAAAVHMAPTTVSAKVEEGLNRLVDSIWRAAAADTKAAPRIPVP